MQQIYRKTPMPKCHCNKFTKQLYISAWVFSCKFAAYLQNTFLCEHLWRAASIKIHKIRNALIYISQFPLNAHLKEINSHFKLHYSKALYWTDAKVLLHQFTPISAKNVLTVRKLGYKYCVQRFAMTQKLLWKPQ